MAGGHAAAERQGGGLVSKPVRYIVMGRWATSAPGDPIVLEGTRVECKTAAAAIGAAKLLLDEVGVWQISITDLEHKPEIPVEAKQAKLEEVGA